MRAIRRCDFCHVLGCPETPLYVLDRYTMPLNIPTGFGQAAFVLTSSAGTAPFITTMGLDLGDVGGDYVEAANSAFAAYQAAFIANTHNSLTLSKVSLAVGADGPGSTYDSSSAPVPGGASFEAEPFSMAIILRKITNTGGRAGRGRMFLPGILAENSVNTSGQITPGGLAELVLNGEEFLTLLSAPVLGPSIPAVLLHTGAGSPSPVVALTPAAKVGWIRGRIY